MKLSGRMTRSTEECEISRSCQSATFSIPTMPLARIVRAILVIRSDPIGLRLWGMAATLFGPRPNVSWTSPISVRCSPRISSAHFSSEAAIIASDDSYSACRSPWITCVETSAGASPRRRHTVSSIVGSRCANVPTAPQIFPIATPSRARTIRARLTLEFRVPQRQLHAERHRFVPRTAGVADHGGVAVFDCPARARPRSRTVDILQDQVAGFTQLQRLRGVDDIGGRQPEVQPRADPAAFSATPVVKAMTSSCVPARSPDPRRCRTRRATATSGRRVRHHAPPPGPR